MLPQLNGSPTMKPKTQITCGKYSILCYVITVDLICGSRYTYLSVVVSGLQVALTFDIACEYISRPAIFTSNLLSR
jgi:hypothetical protein